MSAPLELFVLPWGLYPRRILLYLAEKGLSKCCDEDITKSPVIKLTPVSFTQEGKMFADGKPAGTVPILRLPDGSFIKQSVAILEYFEEVCQNPDPTQSWQAELAKSAARGSMLGKSAAEKGRNRDMLCLADEATSHFGLACHKGSKLFEPLENTNALASSLIMESSKRVLKVLEGYYAEQESISQGRGVTVCDCVLYSLLHFAYELYGRDLLSDPELPSIRAFYAEFGQRDSARVEEGHYPEQIKTLACQWLPLE